MKVKRVAHVAVAAEAMGPVQEIFGDLFAMPLLKEDTFASGTRMAMYDAGNLHVEVLHNASPESLPGSHVRGKGGTGFFHVCLEVENLQEALAELAARGVKLHPNSPRKGATGSSVAFLDPAATGGLLIELAEAH